METIQALASSCKVATAHDKVLNGECCYTFHTPYTTDQGIVVSLTNFIGTCPSLTQAAGLYVRIVKKRVEKEVSEEQAAAAAPTKLAIGVEGGFQTDQDKYETISTHSIVVVDESGSITAEVPYTEENKQNFPTQVAASADAILCHVGLTTQQDVQVWQADEHIPVSKYAEGLPFVDNGVKVPPETSAWKCEKSGDTENLWLNLSDGYIGGGRANWDGSGGSNGALDHFEVTGKQYPLVVKLGTITADLDTADCYSYAPDEDGPVKIPNLSELLAKRGIQVANMQKTVKSTAELEVELNASYAFDAITEAGAKLEPITGAGYQGLANIGNSCYMNSTLQILFSLPEFIQRYGLPAGSALTDHPLLPHVSPTSAPTDLVTQTIKVATALGTGVFSCPLDQDDTDPKYRVAPRMFKHVIGKDHIDFCTAQQQDAPQFLQYLLERLDRAELALSNKNLSSHLFSFETSERLVCSADKRVKYKNSAPETIWSLRIPMDKAEVDEAAMKIKEEEALKSPDQKRQKTGSEDEVVKMIPLETCVKDWADGGVVDDMRWPHLQNAVHPASVQHRFANFPRYLVLQLQRYQLGPDWQPMKLLVNVVVPEEIDLNEYRAQGPSDGEDLVPDDPQEEKTEEKKTVIDEMALAQLMDMGFTLNGCKRALTAVGGSNVEAAMGWVFEHNNDPDFNDPLPEDGGATKSAPGVDEGVVQSLVASLGCFTADQVRAALKETNGAADRAADWLFSHMDDLDGAIAALESEQAGSQPAPKVPLADGNGKYMLKGMISHIGKHTGSGHYVAHVKKDGKWVIFNDEKVAVSAEPPFPHAYLYIFQRVDSVDSPDANY